MSSLSRTWGTEPDERLMEFPCDRFMERFDDIYYRGVTIQSQPEVIYQWLCQLRVAPYSYDLLDNFGRKSPQNLIPGLDELAVGQRIAVIGVIVDFEKNRHITMMIKQKSIGGRIFGEVAGSYLIIQKSSHECRLLVKIIMKFPRGPYGWTMRAFLPWGDLIMTRRQLLNFKRLAEQTGAGIVGQDI